MSVFDEDIKTRRGTNSAKWRNGSIAVPLTIADMDFPVCKTISDGIILKAQDCRYGYSEVGDDWYEAYYSWWQEKHDFKMNKDRLLFVSGVVAAISSAVRRFTNVHDNVVVLTPVYNIFFNSIINNGRHVLPSKLLNDGENYSIDFEDLENKLKDPLTTLLIFCNPHNPVGKIYNSEEMIKVGKLCKKHGVLVVSDEIHCDITSPSKSYTPFMSCSKINQEISIMLISFSKAFNLAGLQSAAIYAPNVHLYNGIRRQINTDEVAEPNYFAAVSPALAVQCEEWLFELNEYIEKNKKYVYDYFKKHMPKFKTKVSDATYLLWVDISKLTPDGDTFTKILEKDYHVEVSKGSIYGADYKGYIRINLATSREILSLCLEKIKDCYKNYKKY